MKEAVEGLSVVKVYRTHDEAAPVDCQRCEGVAKFMIVDTRPLWKKCREGYTSLCGKCIKALGFRAEVQKVRQS